jgi:hypothetical protein
MLNVITRTPKKAPAGDNRGEGGTNTMRVLIHGRFTSAAKLEFLTETK